MKTYIRLLILGLLLLAACQSMPIASPVTPPVLSPTISPLPTSPALGVSPILSPLPPLGASDAEMLQVQVANELGVSVAALTLIEALEVTWPSAALGCPQPDMAYADVLVPGWQVTFEDAAGLRYRVHTGHDMQQFVICDPPVEDNAHVPAEVLGAAVRVVAERSGVAAGSVVQRFASQVEWPDSCLGCAAPGTACATVITPGYRLVLEADGRSYTVHTDATGRNLVVCERQP